MSVLATVRRAKPIAAVPSLLQNFRNRQRALPAPLRLHWLSIVTALLFLAIGAWSVSTPTWASPDEQQHAIRAYGVAHGQLVVHDAISQTGLVTGGLTQIPRGWRDSLLRLHCFAFKKDVPASCLPGLTNDRRLFNARSSAEHYDPIFYGVSGAPTRYFSPSRDLIAMRLVSALLCAICLAWGLTAIALSKRGVLAVSITLLGLTPMVLFISGSLNPNGLEICAALPTWMCLYWAFAPPSAAARTVLLRRAGLAACAMVVTRTLSPLWLLVIAVILLALIPLRQLRQAIDWQLARWAALVLATSLFAIGWTISQHANDTGTLARPTHYSLMLRLRLSWGWWPRQRHFAYGQVGNFGWLDTPLPHRAIYPTVIAVAIALVAALLLGRWRERLALVMAIVAIVAIPVILNALTWNSTGTIWQSRYIMPLSVGAVALSGTVIASRLPRVLSVLTIPATVGALVVVLWTQLTAIAVAMSRYIVGLSHPITLTGGYWQPPHGALLWFWLELISLASLLAALATLSMRTASDNATTHLQQPATDLARL